MEFIPISSSSKGNAYLLKSQGVAPLLVECGIPIAQLRQKLWDVDTDVSDLDACLISHSHSDHSKAVKDILKAGIDVWTSIETAEALGIAGHHRHVPINSEHVYGVSTGWRVIPFDLHHDVPCHGFMISSPDGERLVFVPDTSYIRNRFAGMNILAIECNYISGILNANIEDGAVPEKLGRRVRRNHMSLESVIRMIKANDLSACRQIWLLHLSDSNSDEGRMVRAVQEATGIPCRACQE